jgi:hypothetical protein
MVVLVGLLACAGCASTGSTQSYPPDERPVGTTGTTSATVPSTPTQVNSAERGVIPVGQELDVRLQSTLSSRTAAVEQRFETTTVVDLIQDDAILVPAGSTVRGVVSSVSPAGNIDRSGSMTLSFDQLTVKGRSHPLRAMATQAFESRGIRDEVGTVGTAGAVGAIVGGIVGGLRGAVIGAAIGGGGVIAATEGKDVELPAGTIVRIRLDSPVEIR